MNETRLLMRSRFFYNVIRKIGDDFESKFDPDKTVEIANYMKSHAENGDVIFYDIYTDEEKAADPAKEDTGLFFFKGDPGERFAVCNAGGGFAYVGAMHDSFPHALELSKMGYNAFALIYRPGAQTACEDLARAISFIFENADELEVNTDCYSLWGGSPESLKRAWNPNRVSSLRGTSPRLRSRNGNGCGGLDKRRCEFLGKSNAMISSNYQ